MNVTTTKDGQYVIKSFQIDNELSLSMAYEESVCGKVANGGLRFYQYPDQKTQENEALVLAQLMAQKHSIYNTGFTGVKLVAKGKITPENKHKLLTFVGDVLNSMNGKIFTGCDLNINNDDMNYLSQLTPYVLNSNTAPQINTSTATAYGVYGSLKAVINQSNDARNKKTFLVHGIGKIGKIIAQRLLDDGYKVYTFDALESNADLDGSINISKNAEWYKIKCDYLILCSASNIITENNVEYLNCKWIISSSNSPFENMKVKKRLRAKSIKWVPDVVSNAGAVICDSIEFNEPENYKALNSRSMYRHVFHKIFNKTKKLLRLAAQYNLSPDEALDVFLKIAQQVKLHSHAA